MWYFLIWDFLLSSSIWFKRYLLTLRLKLLLTWNLILIAKIQALIHLIWSNLVQLAVLNVIPITYLICEIKVTLLMISVTLIPGHTSLFRQHYILLLYQQLLRRLWFVQLNVFWYRCIISYMFLHSLIICFNDLLLFWFIF